MYSKLFSRRGPSTRSYLNTNKATLHAVIEVLWLDNHRCISELSLLVNPSATRCGLHGRLDVLIISLSASAAIELKYITIDGLWKGCGGHEKPSWDDLEVFRKELNTETEEHLLRRSFFYHDKDAGLWRKKTVQTLMDEAMSQARKYMRIIQGGMAEDSSAGILDRRVRCTKGQSDLYGYVIICIGDSRVLTWNIGSEQLDFILQPHT
jgi:hypothetical protein